MHGMLPGGRPGGIANCHYVMIAAGQEVVDQSYRTHAAEEFSAAIMVVADIRRSWTDVGLAMGTFAMQVKIANSHRGC